MTLARFSECEFDDEGDVIVPTSVTVTDEDGGAASLFSDREGTVARSNPFAPVGGNDSFTNVLLHFEGAIGSQSIVDDGALVTRAWTATGAAQIDSEGAFGTSLLLGTSFNDTIETDEYDDLDLGAGDFTIDLRFLAEDAGGAARVLAQQVAFSTLAHGNSSWQIRKTAGNVITASVAAIATATTVTGTTQYTSSLNPGWHHVEFVRTGNTLKLFVDGAQQGGDVAFSGTVNPGATEVRVGGLTEFSELWTGNIDEFRISVGTARHTSNFTPPTEQYEAADGPYFFHVAGGSYRIDVTDGVTSRVRRYVPIGTGGEIDAEYLPGESPIPYDNGCRKLETISIDSGDTSAEFTANLDSTFNAYEIRFSNLTPQFTGQSFNLRLASGNSPGFNDGTADYAWNRTEGTQFSLTASASSADDEIVLYSAADDDVALNGWIRFSTPTLGVTVYVLFDWQIAANTPGGMATAKGSGRLKNLGAITGLQFRFGAAASWKSGSLTLYGYETTSIIAPSVDTLDAIFGGSGVLTALTRQNARAQAALAGASALQANAQLPAELLQLHATFAGAGVLSALARSKLRLQVSMAGAGSLFADAVLPAAASTTWNSADKSSSINLSNGDLTATSIEGASNNSVRTVAGKSSGKYYCEFSSLVAGSGVFIGLANSSLPIEATSDFPGADADGVGYYSVLGQVFLDSGSIGTIVTYTTGDLIDMALDLDNERIWFRKNNGNWNNSGAANPATNTGGFDISGLNAGPYFVVWTCAATANETVTANFGATSFAHTAPSGFGNFG